MKSWERDRAVERTFMLAAGKRLGISEELARELDDYRASRALPGPVVFADRSMFTEQGEEHADAENYAIWGAMKARGLGRPDLVEACEHLLDKTLAAHVALVSVREMFGAEAL